MTPSIASNFKRNARKSSVTLYRKFPATYVTAYQMIAILFNFDDVYSSNKSNRKHQCRTIDIYR